MWRSGAGLVNQIVAGLKARKKTVPGYLELIALTEGKTASSFETAVFGMS